MNDLDNNALETALAAGKALGEIKRVNYDGVTVPFMVRPDGYEACTPEVTIAEKWMERPVRKRGTFSFMDVDSFVRYFNEHKNESSRIFAAVNCQGAQFRAILDFHGTLPSHQEHVCIATLRPTPEWTTFTGNAKRQMSQADFAQFLEDNANLFASPSGADLLEIISDLEGSSNATIKQALKTSNGQVRITYNEEIELKAGSRVTDGQLEIPTLLSLTIAPFEGVTHYTMQARLRHRIQNQKINFWYEPINLHEVMRMVTTDLLATIEKITGINPFRQ